MDAKRRAVKRASGGAEYSGWTDTLGVQEELALEHFLNALLLKELRHHVQLTASFKQSLPRRRGQNSSSARKQHGKQHSAMQ